MKLKTLQILTLLISFNSYSSTEFIGNDLNGMTQRVQSSKRRVNLSTMTQIEFM